MGSPLVREFDVSTGLLLWITSTSFGAGRNLGQTGCRALRSAIGPEGLRAFHRLMRDALHSEPLYARVEHALITTFPGLPVLTIFGKRNDQFAFQTGWKALFPGACQVVVPGGHHFPMRDNPDLVATTVRTWYSDVVAA